MKKTIFLSFILLVTFLAIDSQTYYYGFGKGFLSDKIPNRFSILFAGSDLGDQGMILKENDMKLHIIRANGYISMNKGDSKINIKKFIGYWFTSKTIVANVKDEKNNNRYINIYEEETNSLYPNFILKELKYKPSEFSNIKYIDLDKNLQYFKILKLVKNLIFGLWIISILYGFKLFYKKKRLARSR
jgi:hypothetical protein